MRRNRIFQQMQGTGHGWNCEYIIYDVMKKSNSCTLSALCIRGIFVKKIITGVTMTLR